MEIDKKATEKHRSDWIEAEYEVAKTWQETIMSDDEFLEWCGSHIVKGCGNVRIMQLGEDEFRKVSICDDCRAKAQAEISFNAGRQEGIREVIDKIKSHQLIEPKKDSITRFEPFYQIEQSELREWEIK